MSAVSKPGFFSSGASGVTIACFWEYYKKLNYCKQIAHQLRTQYIEDIYSNAVILISRLAITQRHGKWHHSVDRILMYYSNYGTTLIRFRDLATYWLNIAKFLYPACI